MTIDDAVEILSEEIKHPYSAKKMGRPDALKLGREALLRVNELRKYSPAATYMPLRGETEE